MSEAAHTFWCSQNKYHDLAKKFEEGVEIVSPPYAKCWCSDYCPWRATEITYYEYRGEQV